LRELLNPRRQARICDSQGKSSFSLRLETGGGSPKAIAGFFIKAGLPFAVSACTLADPLPDPSDSHPVPAVRHHADADLEQLLFLHSVD